MGIASAALSKAECPWDMGMRIQRRWPSGFDQRGREVALYLKAHAQGTSKKQPAPDGKTPELGKSHRKAPEGPLPAGHPHTPRPAPAPVSPCPANLSHCPIAYAQRNFMIFSCNSGN